MIYITKTELMDIFDFGKDKDYRNFNHLLAAYLGRRKVYWDNLLELCNTPCYKYKV